MSQSPIYSKTKENGKYRQNPLNSIQSRNLFRPVFLVFPPATVLSYTNKQRK